MNCDRDENSSIPQNPVDEESRSAVNSLILDYYKKFGRKRDLEQYFSLSTAQSEIRDPSSLFWARMKTENESSDSGEKSDNKKSESSQELCRISIRFPAQDLCSSQEEDSKTKTESVSPPIIIEELPRDSRPNSEDEAIKSDDGVKTDDDIKSEDNNSQKSFDILLDTSLNKLHSPSSSITSQRRLEWDSLADVGYANESDRKTSASSLSTLERLALKQQYSNNDTQQNSNLGIPTAHSTPLEENETKSKCKKGVGKKSTKIYKKDVDLVEVNVPHSSKLNPAQSINVNLTKHISFNVEKDGKVTIDNIQKDISVSPEKIAAETKTSPKIKMDRDVQTSLPKVSTLSDNNQPQQKIPILISLNTLKSRVRRRRIRMARRKLKTKRKDKENIPVQEKSGEQVSEAESFEYMPGHIYNQNQMTANNNRPNIPDNKSSLESSGVLTSDSSKGSKHSFTKDLEKSIDLLRAALQKRCDDSSIRKQLIQQVCQRLLNSKYRDDDSTTDFLSGLSFGSKKLGLGEPNNTTTSTSDANNSAEKTKKQRKSILRTEKFNAGSIASTSQSVPNLPIASNSEKLVSSNLTKNVTTSNTESDLSSKNNTSSENGLTKTSSEELYKKYLQALKREEAYKKHLKDKEMFLKQKLVSSDSAFKVPVRVEVKPSTPNSRLKDLINDLTRNNYDDGSGDASKLEGGPSSHSGFDRVISNRNQRSHSVFTLSSGLSEALNKKSNLKKKLQSDLKDLSKPGPSREAHYCCCPHHGNLKFADSSVQVNIKKPCKPETCPGVSKIEKQKLESPSRLAKIIADGSAGNLEYVCLCNRNAVQDVPDDFLIYRCSRLANKGIQLEDTSSKSSTEASVQCNDNTCPKRHLELAQYAHNKSSQTDMLIKMMNQLPSTFVGSQKLTQIEADVVPLKSVTSIYESTRWIQTEISINPKIAEPTLSDINIVSDTNCAKLISENRRELSKPSLTDLFSTQAVASSATGLSSSNKSTGSSKDMELKFQDYDGSSKSKDTSSSVPDPNFKLVEHTEKFTIPIHGTNMTLMVSLGSEQTVNPNKTTKQMVTQGIGTEKNSAIEQATSVIEECSRGVQADKVMETDVNSNQIENENLNTDRGTCISQKPLTVNTCLSAKDAQFSTYPKTSPVNEQKSLRRINTDTDKVQAVAFSKSVKGGEEINQPRKSSIKISDKFSRTTSPDIYSDLNENHDCSCGCKGKIENCKLDCMQRKLMQDRNQSIEKEMSTQVDSGPENTENVINNKNEKCSCGCGFSSDNCNECTKKCIEPTPSKQYYKKSMDSKATSPIRTSNTQNEKCPCGCGGTKNMCKNTCKELTKRECGTQPCEDTSIQTCGSNSIGQSSPKSNYVLEKKDTCSCGCGSTKNKCKKSCPELQSSPRYEGPERKQTLKKSADRKIGLSGEQSLNREIDKQPDISLIQNERCPCGCGGTKDRCKRSCKELKTLPRYDKEEANRSQQNRRYSSPSRIPQYRRSSSPKRRDKYGTEILSNINTQTDIALTQRGRCEQSSDKEINTQTDSLVTDYDTCSCGCGSTKDKCKRTCKELQSSPRYEIAENRKRKQSFSKQIDTQTDCSLNENDYVEQKLTPRELLRKQDIIVNTAQCFSDSYEEKCPCGCGGMKNKCSSSCQELKSTPRERNRKEKGTQKDREDSPPTSSRSIRSVSPKSITRSAGKVKQHEKPLKIIDSSDQTDVKSSDKGQKSTSETDPAHSGSDPIINMIQNITKKYAKKDIEKNKRKKCFKEIMTVLNYLLETEDDIGDGNKDLKHRCESSTSNDETDACVKIAPEKSPEKKSKKVDKGVQPSSKKTKVNPCGAESSEVITSTDIPGTSSDSATCKVLNKIKKECERYHQKCCKMHSGKNCEGTSSTSMNCDKCRRVHHCQCRSHKCKNHKKLCEKIPKSPVAYNLILQTSESVISDGPSSNRCDKIHQLKNIIVKVPKKKPPECMPFREIAAKFERRMPCNMHCGVQKDVRSCRSRSLPNESEISSMEEIIRQSQGATVREYLERNRPDFIEKCNERQTCMRYISETRCEDPKAPTRMKMVIVHTPNCTGSCNPFYAGVRNDPMTCMSTQCFQPRLVNVETGVARIANERAVKRDLLSMHLAQLPDVTELESGDLRRLASELGRYMRQKQPAPKFINEREMKKHSEKIYKSLPEVVQKKEEQKKENIKKTNLLMANIFKRNLQKKTLRGSVNLSNYSTVIKI